MCWTPPYTRPRQIKHNKICVGHHHTQDEDKQNIKHDTLCVGHHHTQDEDK